MCLHSIEKTFPGTTTAIESGWKYFLGTENDVFPHAKWNNRIRCPLDKWITATGDSGEANLLYKVGFHVFTDEKKARQEKSAGLRRVYFRRVTARGIDQGIETVVAQEIYVPSREAKWPPLEKGA